MKLALRITLITTLGISAAFAVDSLFFTRSRDLDSTAIPIAVSAIVSFALAYVFIGRPTQKLVVTSRLISRGDFASRLKPVSRDEISELAAEMNTMAEQLQEATERAENEAAARLATVEQLRHVDRLKTVGQLTSGVVHEIGTPLTVILGRARMIQRGEATGEEAKDCAKVAVEQTERVAKIVRQMLDFARRESDKERPPKDLSEMAQNMVKLLIPVAVRSGIYLEYEKTDEPTVAGVDMSQIQQALANLAMNAIQATKSGGRVVVGMTREVMKNPNKQADPSKPYLKLYVRDEGQGVSEDIINRIFEPFFTTKAAGRGTGLGLPISREIVRDHGGWISVDSEPGKGSCFTIHLPAEEEQA